MMASGLEGILKEMAPNLPELTKKLDMERVELAQKIERLKTFMTLDARYQELDHYQSRLLEEQLVAMNTYEGILVQRMTLLNQKED
jgi:hypothetical protein